MKRLKKGRRKIVDIVHRDGAACVALLITIRTVIKSELFVLFYAH